MRILYCFLAASILTAAAVACAACILSGSYSRKEDADEFQEWGER